MTTKIILGIETSCDDTAVSVVRGEGGTDHPHFETLAQVVSSQTAIHAHWGGVVPSLAKREHGRNLVPVLLRALADSGLKKIRNTKPGTRNKFEISEELKVEISEILHREPELLEQFLDQVPKLAVPPIDTIAVTHGPGLEPALWAGLNFAHALASLWQKTIIPVNHLEGHIMSALAGGNGSKQERQIKFPLLALIVSGGHTELVFSPAWFEYELIGETRDDACGEAFDKVARMLGLPYPGGPALSKLARQAPEDYAFDPLPRPMIDSADFDFSFSGLKTAVRYRLGDSSVIETGGETAEHFRAALAKDFEQAVSDILIKKTILATEKYRPKTVVASGGVTANERLRHQLTKAIAKLENPPTFLIPESGLTTDNATMIAMAGYLRSTLEREPTPTELAAEGRLTLD